MPPVEPGGSPEPYTFRSRLLDGFFNPVAAFGSVNIDGDLMFYAGLIEHSTFDRLQCVEADDPFPTGFHGEFVKTFSRSVASLGHEMLRDVLIDNDLHGHGWSLPDCAHHNIGTD